MRLKNGPFKAIKSGTKKVELRLNDEKRKLIKEHDIIEFENRITLEKIEVEVIKIDEKGRIDLKRITPKESKN